MDFGQNLNPEHKEPCNQMPTLVYFVVQCADRQNERVKRIRTGTDTF